MEELAELEAQIKIDQRFLDRELIQQPDRFYRASKLYALASSRRDQLKNKLKEVAAESQGKIRRRAEAKGIKMTEAMVAAKVDEHADVKAIRDQLIGAQMEVDLLTGLKEAFVQRSYMLRELCGITIAGITSSNAVRGENSRELQEERHVERRKKIRAASND